MRPLDLIDNNENSCNDVAAILTLREMHDDEAAAFIFIK